VHSHYSSDSTITPEQLVFYAGKSGLDGVAVTDHDRLDGALEIAKHTSFLIIPGIEVSSRNGHIVGLNVQEPIAKGMTAEETVVKIHDAGGIAVACHPVALFKGSLGKHVNSKFDAIEVVNSSALPFGYSVRRSMDIASRLRLPRVAGSDAHYALEIGSAYTLAEAESNVNDVVKAICNGKCQPFGRAIPLKVRLKRRSSLFARSSSIQEAAR